MFSYDDAVPDLKCSYKPVLIVNVHTKKHRILPVMKISLLQIAFG
jgi:hypothetical protein